VVCHATCTHDVDSTAEPEGSAVNTFASESPYPQSPTALRDLHLGVPPTPTLADCVSDSVALLSRLEAMSRSVENFDRRTGGMPKACSSPPAAETPAGDPPSRRTGRSPSRLSEFSKPSQDGLCQHFMNAKMIHVLGLSNEAVLSLKVGEARRQASVGAMLQRPLRIPAVPTGGTQFCSVTILSVLAGASLVLHPGKTKYRTRLQGAGGKAAAPVALTARGHWGSALQGLGMQAEQANKVKEYMQAHHLLQYVPALLQAAIQERAEDPYAFMRGRVAELLEGDLPSSTAPGSGAVAGGGGGVELEISIAEKLPEGSVVSVRLGNERRQVRAKAAGEVLKVRFAQSALSPLKLAVLVPEASKKFLISEGKEQYNLRLNPKEGGDIALDLAMQMQQSAPGDLALRGGVASASDDLFEPEPASDGQQYLERHSLLGFARDLMKGLADKRPEDPYKFAMNELSTRMQHDAPHPMAGAAPVPSVACKQKA